MTVLALQEYRTDLLLRDTDAMISPALEVLSTSLPSLVESRIDSLPTFRFPQAGDAVVATDELTKASASLTRNSSRLRSQALVSSQSS